ncbi:MAG: DUF881 domain-containing protein [Chthonomonadales bacterium]
MAGSITTVSGLRRTGATGRVGTAIASQTEEQARATKEQGIQIQNLQKDKTKLENSLAENGGQAKTLNDELQKVKVTAGLAEVKGPGIILTLQDSKKGPASNRQYEADNFIIHDVTLMRALNELNASGAEAISINGQRFVGRTAIRCVGPTAQVNGVPLASPYYVRVIGDPDTLAGGLSIPEGFMDFMRSYDPEMAKIEKKKDLIVPAYTGTTELRYARHTATVEKKQKRIKDAGNE